jgi:hypothetical protein
MKKTKRKAKRQTDTGAACEMVICEDPVTGNLIAKPKGKCPPGYVERMKKNMATHGVVFPVEEK